MGRSCDTMMTCEGFLTPPLSDNQEKTQQHFPQLNAVMKVLPAGHLVETPVNERIVYSGEARRRKKKEDR